MSVFSSVYALVNSNSGLFVSEKQAAFFNAMQAKSGCIFMQSGQVYKNGYTITATCDATGILTIEKNLKVNTVVMWTRENHGEYVEKQQAKKAQAEKLQSIDAILTRKNRAQKLLDSMPQVILGYMRKGVLEEMTATLHRRSTLLQNIVSDCNAKIVW